MSLSLLFLEYPVCLVSLIWVFEMGGRWAYSSCFVVCGFRDLFNISRCIIVQFLSSFFSNALSISKWCIHTVVWIRPLLGKKLSFSSLITLHSNYSISIACYRFIKVKMLTQCLFSRVVILSGLVEDYFTYIYIYGGVDVRVRVYFYLFICQCICACSSVCVGATVFLPLCVWATLSVCVCERERERDNLRACVCMYEHPDVRTDVEVNKCVTERN